MVFLEEVNDFFLLSNSRELSFFECFLLCSYIETLVGCSYISFGLMSVKMMSESRLRSLTCVILSQWSPRCWCMDLDRVRGSTYAVLIITY